jgi:alcohol dehydrogenase class IV
MARLAASLRASAGDPAGALWDLAVASNVPTRLADLQGHDGLLKREDLAEAARVAVDEIKVNPRPVTEADLLGILERAYEGERP